MKLTRDLLIKGAQGSESFDELAEKIGWEDSEDLVTQCALLCPGIEILLEWEETRRELELCRLGEDLQGRREVSERLQDLTIQLIDAGFMIPSMKTTLKKEKAPKMKKADIPATVKTVVMESALKVPKVPKVSKVKAVPTKSRPSLTEDEAEALRKTLKVCKLAVDCKAIAGDILGIDGEYQGRVRVRVFLRPGLFGSGVIINSSVRGFTLHKGILNHCTLEEQPSPYWAILDAMSDLGTFTKAEVVAHAIKLYSSKRDPAKSVEDWEKAASIAYDVLKTHHRHPRKKEAGMSHLVENCIGEKGRSLIRGRKGHETLDFFEELEQKAETSEKKGVPMASLEQ